MSSPNPFWDALIQARVLSLDGGRPGTTEFSQLFILINLLYALSEGANPDLNEAYLTDYFDYIWGSGVGSLVAILSVVLKLPIASIASFYIYLDEKLFSRPDWETASQSTNFHNLCQVLSDVNCSKFFEHNGLERGINSILSSSEDVCHAIMCTVTPVNLTHPRLFATFRARYAPLPCNVRDALHISLADGIHLPPFNLSGEIFTGAAHRYNNALHTLLDEMESRGHRHYMIVSVGAGYPGIVEGVVESGKSSEDCIRDAESCARECQRRDLPFYRFNVAQGLDTKCDLGEIRSHTYSYLEDTETSRHLDDVVKTLKSLSKKNGNLPAHEDRNTMALRPERPHMLESFGGDDIDSHIRQHIFIWLVYGREPFSFATLRNAVMASSRRPTRHLNENSLKDLYWGLVVLNQGVVSFADSTAKHIFEQDAARIFPDPQWTMAKGCLTYLLRHKAEEKRVSPFFSYCVRHWHHHAQMANEIDQRTLASYLQNESFPRRAFRLLAEPLLQHMVAYFGLHSHLESILTPESVNNVDRESRTALHYASMQGHKESVRILLAKKNIIVDLKDIHDRSALSYAAAEGHIEVVSTLLHIGNADQNTFDWDKFTPLFFAAFHGHNGVVQLLLPNADPGWRDVWRKTALFYAVQSRKLSTVELMLQDRRVNPHIVDLDRRTPLSFAAEVGELGMVKLLLEREVLHLADKNKRSPISFSATSQDEQVAKLLLNAGENPDSSDKYGRTPLSFAAKFGNVPMVDMLLKNNRVKPDTADMTGRTPLSYAAQYGQLAVVQRLIQEPEDRIDPDSYDSKGFTPLLHVVTSTITTNETKLLVVDHLVQLGTVDINARDNDRRTALWHLKHGRIRWPKAHIDWLVRLGASL